jgi:hypothetical protein
VKSLVAAQHHSSSGAEAKIYPRGSANQERVRSVGVRVLEAARAYVKAEQHKLETELEVSFSLIAGGRGEGRKGEEGGSGGAHGARLSGCMWSVVAGQGDETVRICWC